MRRALSHGRLFGPYLLWYASIRNALRVVRIYQSIYIIIQPFLHPVIYKRFTSPEPLWSLTRMTCCSFSFFQKRIARQPVTQLNTTAKNIKSVAHTPSASYKRQASDQYITITVPRTDIQTFQTKPRYLRSVPTSPLAQGS